MGTGSLRQAILDSNAQSGAQTIELQVRGSVNTDGPPLAVMDIAGAQANFGWLGRISRIDVRTFSRENPDMAANLRNYNSQHDQQF